jgi:hypothetical protein
MEDGGSRREHFESAARQGYPSPEAIGPSIPEELRYLWSYFLDIHDGRTINGMSAARATHMDLMAWQWNTGIKLLPWEVRAVTALGNTWMLAQNKPEKKS